MPIKKNPYFFLFESGLFDIILLRHSLNLAEHKQYCYWQTIILKERSQHGII